MYEIRPQAASNFEPVDFPHRLVPTTRIEGATVYNADGERLGTISSLMADNQTGRIEYAVLSLGGFLGMGESQHPLPWDRLGHDTRRGGYVLDVDKRLLRGGPSYRASDEPDFDQAYASRVTEYYGAGRPAPQTDPRAVPPSTS
jgi:sporulation protein YlmC with PRC-barrel domain